MHSISKCQPTNTQGENHLTTQPSHDYTITRRLLTLGAAAVLALTGLVAVAQPAEAVTCAFSQVTNTFFTGGNVTNGCPNGIRAAASIRLPNGAVDNIVRTGQRPEISTSVPQFNQSVTRID